MHTHNTGGLLGNRQGCDIIIQSYQFNAGTTPTATDVILGTFPATVANPIALRVSGAIQTSSDAATSDNMFVTSAPAGGGTLFINGLSLKAAPNTSSDGTWKTFTSDVTLYARHVVVGAITTGLLNIIVETAEINVAPFSSLGS